MGKKLILSLIVIAVLLTMMGCNIFQTYDKDKSKNTEIENQLPQDDSGDKNSSNHEEEEKPEEIDPIIEEISKMTLEEKIGQIIIVGMNGYNFDEAAKTLIEKYKIGGFIALQKNVESTSQLLDLLNIIKTENQKNKIPLFLSIDEEGGRVTRMPKEFRKLPTNKAIGKINNSDFSFKIGNETADKIASFGFNMNFAPVLDVNSNPKNPIIGDRAFSSKPDIVSELGIQTMKGMQQGKVIPVIKHFPGHGDTAVDSHVGLPTMNHDLKRLESLELIPFRDAIEAKAEVVMIAHILLPSIDKDNPSSMSKTIITDILREKLNFEGVVITDDMTMGAIMKNYKIGEAAVKSVKAGTDVVLVCHGYENQLEVINALKGAVTAGDITEQRLDESVYRILQLKKKYNLKDEVKGPVDVNKINSDIEALLNNYVQ